MRRFITRLADVIVEAGKPHHLQLQLETQENQCWSLAELESLQSRSTNVQGQRKAVSAQAERVHLPAPFLLHSGCSKLDDAHPQRGGRVSGLSPLIHIPISLRHPHRLQLPAARSS